MTLNSTLNSVTAGFVVLLLNALIRCSIEAGLPQLPPLQPESHCGLVTNYSQALFSGSCERIPGSGKNRLPEFENMRRNWIGIQNPL
jgi:hypothetical protein